MKSPSAPSLAPPARRIVRREPVMGTVVTFDLFCSPSSDLREVFRAFAHARADLHRADAVFSTWIGDSPLSRLRRDETSVHECPAVVGEVLERCRELRDATEGWFDPWAMPGGIDPTGFVKGWAAQGALRRFEELDLLGAIVNAAGDIASFGTTSEGTPFRFGIVDPFRRDRIACVVEGVPALATSGTSERGPHLVDPFRGVASAAVASASVCGPDLGVADALATALAVAGHDALGVLDHLPDYAAMLIELDGARSTSGAFPVDAG